MVTRKRFYSKKFFLFNLILVGIITGFALSFAIFGYSSEIAAGETVQAQEQKTTINKSSTDSLRKMQNSFNKC